MPVKPVPDGFHTIARDLTALRVCQDRREPRQLQPEGDVLDEGRLPNEGYLEQDMAAAVCEGHDLATASTLR